MLIAQYSNGPRWRGLSQYIQTAVWTGRGQEGGTESGHDLLASPRWRGCDRCSAMSPTDIPSNIFCIYSMIRRRRAED